MTAGNVDYDEFRSFKDNKGFGALSNFGLPRVVYSEAGRLQLSCSFILT